MPDKKLKIRRALLTVSDKEGIVELAQALVASGAEIVATGRTALVLKEAGLSITPIETVSGSPEAFQGRMKTLSFPVCSGILYRRSDASDEADLRRLSIQPIDCVVVNFYPFEKAAAKEGISRKELIEEIDIGGPTLVRAAAKNAPDVLVLTSPAQYGKVVTELKAQGVVSAATAEACAAAAWERILDYDRAIEERMGPTSQNQKKRGLRYGENPHQQGHLEFQADSPIAWEETLTPTELSYNNILDLSSAYALGSDLVGMNPSALSGSPSSGMTGVVIIKHNNPCGVSWVPKSAPQAQLQALLRAWEGDPVSAFGGVLVFTDPLTEETASWLSERFVELVAAPGLSKECSSLAILQMKRKNLKAVQIRRFGEMPNRMVVAVPGGMLYQTPDTSLNEELRSVTKKAFPASRTALARFGIAVCRSLKSNALSIVREREGGGFQLVGTGQGQPNRVEALKLLAIPRAKTVLEQTAEGGKLEDCILVSDAFFPFRDTVDAAFEGGIRTIIQPGGSIKDAESIAACDEHGMAMAFTGVRHFKH